MPPLTAQQKADRVGVDGFIGGSEIASIVGENPWSQPIDVWLKKTGRAQEEPTDPRAAVGQRAERLIIDWYAEDTGTPRNLIAPGETMRHRSVSCVGCTPDFLVLSGTGTNDISRAVQLKCVGARMALMWPDEWIPAYVECQVQLEAEVLQVDRVDVAAWLGGTDWRIIQVQRDPEFGAMMVRAAVQFWDCVRRDIPPPVTGSETWRKYLAAKYPKPERTELDQANGTVDEWAAAALRARDDEKKAKELRDEADNRLRNLIGDGSGFLGADYVVTWIPDKNGQRSLRIKKREIQGGY